MVTRTTASSCDGRAGRERRGIEVQALRAVGTAREDDEIPRLVPRAAPPAACLNQRSVQPQDVRAPVYAENLVRRRL